MIAAAKDMKGTVMDRRNFIKKSAVGLGVGAMAAMHEMIDSFPAHALATSRGMGIAEGNYFLDLGREKNIMPTVRPEITRNPRAVFLVRTRVDARLDETGHYTEAWPQLHEEGTRIARYLFVRGERKGGTTFIKPNFTGVLEHCFNRTTGVYSAPDFVVGVVEHLREIGNSNVACGDNPINAVNHRLGGVYDAFDPYDVLMIEAGYDRFSDYEKDELNWVKVKNSLVWNQVPYFKPIMNEDNFFINIATLKNHLTALTTLAVKNLQGCVVKGHGQFCQPAVSLEQLAESAGIGFARGFQQDFFPRVEESYRRHRSFKRWEHNTEMFGNFEKYEELGGYAAYRKIRKDREAYRAFIDQVGNLMRQEMWIHRGLDNAATLRPDLNIIEGIIGLDGNEHSWGEIGSDQLCNIVIAGCSPYEVDAVGNWIMGHDPNEIWYTRIARERGLGECDIEKIEINWVRDDGTIEPVKSITEIPRYKLGVNWANAKDPDERLFW